MQNDLFENENIIRWRFTSLFPLREDAVGEVVFMKKWQDIMGGALVTADQYFVDNEKENFPILGIHQKRFFDTPSDRDTRLATTLVQWLGTMNGQNFLGKAERFKEALGKEYSIYGVNQGMDYSDAYLLSWSQENRRSGSPQYDYTPRIIINQSLCDVFGKAANLRDIEVMECIIDWLGKPDGQRFIQECQKEIASIHKQQRQESLKRSGLSLDI